VQGAGWAHPELQQQQQLLQPQQQQQQQLHLWAVADAWHSSSYHVLVLVLVLEECFGSNTGPPAAAAAAVGTGLRYPREDSRPQLQQQQQLMQVGLGSIEQQRQQAGCWSAQGLEQQAWRLRDCIGGTSRLPAGVQVVCIAGSRRVEGVTACSESMQRSSSGSSSSMCLGPSMCRSCTSLQLLPVPHCCWPPAHRAAPITNQQQEVAAGMSPGLPSTGVTG
jgi:hypothetical protein